MASVQSASSSSRSACASGMALVAVAGHRDPAHEHAGVAQREVQRLDQLGHRAHPAAVTHAGTVTTRPPRAPRRPPPAAHAPAGPWCGRRGAPPAPGRRRRRGCSPPPRAAARRSCAPPPPPARGDAAAALVARRPPRRGRRRRRSGHRSSARTPRRDRAAAWPPRLPARPPGSRRSRPCRAAARRPSRARRSGRSASRPMPSHWVSMSPSADPDGDPDGHLPHPPQPLAVGRAEADHGRHRREERALVVEDVGRHGTTPRRLRSRTGRPATPSTAAGPGAAAATYGCARRRARGAAPRQLTHWAPRRGVPPRSPTSRVWCHDRAAASASGRAAGRPSRCAGRWSAPAPA